MINYHNRSFKIVSNSDNGELSSYMIFHYKQVDNILTSVYSGGEILFGHLIGLVDPNGNIDMRYHQVNLSGEIKTGTCQSIPKILPNGKIRLHETWQWTSGDHSIGTSILEEL